MAARGATPTPAARPDPGAQADPGPSWPALAVGLAALALLPMPAVLPPYPLIVLCQALVTG